MEDNSVHLEMQADCLLILSCTMWAEWTQKGMVECITNPVKIIVLGHVGTVWWIWWYPSTNTVPQEGPTEVLKWSGSPPPVASSYRLHLVRIVFWLSHFDQLTNLFTRSARWTYVTSSIAGDGWFVGSGDIPWRLCSAPTRGRVVPVTAHNADMSRGCLTQYLPLCSLHLLVPQGHVLPDARALLAVTRHWTGTSLSRQLHEE